MSKRLVRVLGLVMLLFAVKLSAADAPWQGELLGGLKSHYQITTRNWLGKIQQPGTVLVVQQDGLQADRPKAVMKPTIIQDGVIAKTGAGGIILGQGGRSLKKGDRVQVYDIRVKDNYVLLLIGTVDTIDTEQNGSTSSANQEAALSFTFTGKPLQDLATDEVLAQINKWLLTESETSAARTISLGQSIDDVVKALGQPTKVVNLGAKKIYYYSDMKVIFQDDKVSDVE